MNIIKKKFSWVLNFNGFGFLGVLSFSRYLSLKFKFGFEYVNEF